MIRFLVDSSSDYSMEEIKEKDLEYVSLCITINEKTYLDGVEMDRNTLYEMLMNGSEFPKTAQPSPESFLEIFEDAKKKGDSVICVALSSGISGTCQSARLAKNIVDYDEVYVIDSLSAACGINILVDHGMKLRDQGRSAKEIAEELDALKDRVTIFAAIDTMEYLYKGGRVNRATAAIGNLANLKPIITLNGEGKIEIPAKCIGKVKAINNVIKLAEEVGIDTDYEVFSIYCHGTENTEKLEDKFAKAGYTVTERRQIGSTIGCHVGPGAFGLIFVNKK